jgi:hypothetical protein
VLLKGSRGARLENLAARLSTDIGTAA